jgi:hypothetical protein
MAASSRYDSALKRNLAELQKVLLIRTTLLGIEKHRHTAKVFIHVINDALYNDYISHAIKLFEKSSKAASFWYLYRTDSGPIDKYAKRAGYDIGNLQVVADKLKIIRNGSHFHIDSAGVLDPKIVWSSAALTGRELGDALDFMWGALSAIQAARGREIPSLPEDYTPEAVLAALQRLECAGPS